MDKGPPSVAAIPRESGLSPVLNAKSRRQEEEGFMNKGCAKFQNKSFHPFWVFYGIFFFKNFLVFFDNLVQMFL